MNREDGYVGPLEKAFRAWLGYPSPAILPSHPFPHYSDVAVASSRIINLAWARALVERELAFHEYLVRRSGVDQW